MKYVVAALVVALIIAHQDNWLWENDELLFGFLPIGLAYHIGISIAASLVWLIAVLFAWPKALDVDEQASEGRAYGQSGGDAK